MSTTKKTEQLNRPIEEYELPDPILTEGVDYHERPDWKKQLAEAEPRIRKACDEAQAKYSKVEDVWQTTYNNLIADVGFPRELLFKDKVSLVGRKYTTKATADSKFFVYYHRSVDFVFGNEWRLNCGIPIFRESWNRIVGKGKLCSGARVKTEDDLKQWALEQIPFTSPTYRVEDFLNGFTEGKWKRYRWALKRVCAELEETKERRGHWEDMGPEMECALVCSAFEAHRRVFPITFYDSTLHCDLRTLFRAMELVKGVVFDGGVIFLDEIKEEERSLIVWADDTVFNRTNDK